MNKETTQLLEKLAQKLGTTAEYLWSVLLYQARIDAVTSVLQYAIIGLAGYALWKTHLHFGNNGVKNRYSYYSEYDGIGLMMILAFIAYLIIVVIAFFSIGDTVNGLLNPEYWALNRVLRELR